MQNQTFCPVMSPTSAVAVEYDYILILIIVEPLGSAELPKCPTVNLESLVFQKLYFHIIKWCPGIRWLLFFFHFPMPCTIESNIDPPKFNSRRGRCPLSENSFTNQKVSGPGFYQLFMLNVNLRKQSFEFLQFWDQHRSSFSQISPAGGSFSYVPVNRLSLIHISEPTRPY